MCIFVIAMFGIWLTSREPLRSSGTIDSILAHNPVPLQVKSLLTEISSIDPNSECRIEVSRDGAPGSVHCLSKIDAAGWASFRSLLLSQQYEAAAPDGSKVAMAVKYSGDEWKAIVGGAVFDEALVKDYLVVGSHPAWNATIAYDKDYGIMLVRLSWFN